jgi:hypothetical protein
MHTHVTAELKHLHNVAEKGESAETPAILIGEVFMFLLPIAIVMMTLAFGLYYVISG